MNWIIVCKKAAIAFLIVTCALIGWMPASALAQNGGYGCYSGNRNCIGIWGWGFGKDAPVQNGAQMVNLLPATWSTNAKNLREQLNQDFTFDCPPNGSPGTVWGTDVYTDDSSICTAAVHDSLIAFKDGGQVTIRILPGASSYAGTTKNGVSTQSYSNWDGSYAIISAMPNISLLPATWSTNATDLREQLDQDVAFDCPANGSPGTVWGTDIYTDDSSVCTAAVHAGLIALKDGGPVIIKVLPGASSYTGTTKNGVSTRSYGSWDGSYAIISAQANGIQSDYPSWMKGGYGGVFPAR